MSLRSGRRRGTLVVMLAACTVLCGCIELSEEVWVNDDLSGRVRWDFALSSAVVAMAQQNHDDPLAEMRADFEKTRAELAQDPNVTQSRFEDYAEGGYHHFVIDVELKDVRRIGPGFNQPFQSQEALGGASSDEPTGHMTVEKLDNGNLAFVQVFEQGGTTPAADEEDPERLLNEAMLASMFAGRNFTVTLHAPNVVDTNGRYSEEQSLVTWQVPLSELMTSDPMRREMRAEFKPPTNWLMVLVLVAVLLLGGLALVAIVSISRVSRTRPPLEGA